VDGCTKLERQVMFNCVAVSAAVISKVLIGVQVLGTNFAPFIAPEYVIFKEIRPFVTPSELPEILAS
jgi:hypothetical protein